MDFDDEDIPQRSNNQLAGERTDLAFERSRLASDRTTMGYMRTATSLVGFGFSIPALFRILTDVPGLEEVPIEHARFVGLFMLILAVIMLSVAIIQQITFLKRISDISGKPFPISPALVSAGLILAVAIYATISILWNVEPL